MRAISPIVEHVILSAGALVFFILVVLSFNMMQDSLLDDDINNRLQNLATQVSLAISQAYQVGMGVDEISPDEPVSVVYLDLPPALAGNQYVITFDDGMITAASKGMSVEVELLGLENQVTVQGKIVGSSIRKPAVSYYKSQNVLILENTR